MIRSADIRWSKQAAALPRRQLMLWTAAALVIMSAHAGAAWVAFGLDSEPPIEQVAGGAIEIDLAALGFTTADQLAAGSVSDAVEPTEAQPVEPVETATQAEPAEKATEAEPVEPAALAERSSDPVPDEAARPAVDPVAPVEDMADMPAARPSEQTPPIESPRASEVTIAAASPAAPVEPEPEQAAMGHAVPVPVEEAEPVGETEVAAIVNVPLPTPRPDYTPTAMPRPEKPRTEPQRQAEAPREAPQQKKAETPPPPKKSGSGGQNQADARKGTAQGSAQGRAADQGNKGSSRAGNAAVSNYPGKVSSKIRRALRYPAAAKRDRLRGEVHVAFTVSRSGGLGSVRVARSSGSPILDQAAVETVRRAAPFPPIPDGRASWPFTVPLSFTR